MKYIVPILFLLLLVSACNTAKLSNAEATYDRGEYFAAANIYKKVYAKTSSVKDRKLKGMIAFKMGNSYRLINWAPRASAAYQNAIRYKCQDSTVYLYLGQTLQKEGKYKEAIKQYELFLQKKPNDELSLNGIKGCNLAMQWKANPTRYKVRKSDIHNSRYSEFSPVFGDKASTSLYITSSNDKAIGTAKSEITGTKNNNIFISKKDEKGQWQRPETIEGELNSEYDEGAVCLSPDGATMYLTKAKRIPTVPTSTQIYTSTRTGAKWSAPVPLKITNDTLSLYAHPAVSPDGRYLYFVSDMPGGMGGKDIWRGKITNSGITDVENLGSDINTAGDEMFPTIRENGVLYFSSNGHPGMGGLDIFKATETAPGKWKIENLQPPINSEADDFGMTFELEGESGFFSSNRNDGRGYDHIYSFNLPILKIEVQGFVLDRDEDPVDNAIVRIVGKDGSNQKITVKKDGSYKFKVNLGTDYVMMSGGRGFLNSTKELTTVDKEEDQVYNVDFTLASITKPVLIENIFYDFDKATLRPESSEALENLIKLLKDNPNVTIELAAHTDMIGNEEYNIKLSERRAQSVVDFLIAGGIEKDRLTPKGYGKSVPKIMDKKLSKTYPMFKEGTILNDEFILTLTPEQQDVANQINRRTEFKVLKTTYNMY